MIEIDCLFSSFNRRKKYELMFIGFFFTKDRSDEILEVGAIDMPLLQWNMN